MNEQRLNTLLSIVLGLATLLLGYIKLGENLRSTRPPRAGQIDIPQATGQRVTARLWEDPLAATANIGESQSTPIESLRAEIQKSIAARHGPALVVAMVEGTPYPEEAEVRLRTRYAIQMAMIAEGYVPRDRAHLGLTHAPWPESQATSDDGLILSDDTRTSLAVPYEWFDRESQDGGGCRNSVLLVWLREERCADLPLSRLGILIHELSSTADDRWPVHVLGPRSSNTLNAFAQDNPPRLIDRRSFRHLCGPSAFASRVTIFSSAATAPDPLLIRGATNGWSTGRVAMAGQFAAREDHASFRNYIATDDQLAELLVTELINRGASELATIHPTYRPHIAVVSEGDTFYGRALPAVIQAAVLHAAEPGTNTLTHLAALAAGHETAPEHVLFYPYLRGLDGRKAEQPAKPTATPEPAAATPTAAIERALETRSESPEGEAQFDYAERLGDRLVAQDRALRRSGRGRIFAVGLTGSDVYDKLLLLQALRRRLPEALFFTTDLDVRLCDPTQRRFTHNLLVASAYGLDPTNGLTQAIPPPFRDVYQSAMFTATRAALHRLSGLTSGAPVLSLPRLFEIGRNGPVALSTRLEPELAGEGSPLPPDRWKFWAAALLGLGLGGVGLWFILHGGAGELKGWLRTCLPVTALLVLVGGGAFSCGLTAERPGEEPWLLFSGVSIWPTALTRLVAIGLTILLLLMAWQRDREHRRRLYADYFGTGDPNAIPPEPRPPAAKPGSSAWQRLRAYLASITLNGWERPELGVDAEAAFAQYSWRALGRHRYLRMIPMIGLYVLVAYGLMRLLGGVPERTCVRGEGSRVLDLLFLGLSVGLFLILLFYVLDTARLTGKLLERLGDAYTLWPERIRQQAARVKQVNPQLLEGWLDVRFAAENTREINRLMYLPFLVLLLLLLSRNKFFDNWTWPASLVAIFSLNFVATIYCWRCVRGSARKLRQRALESLQTELIRVRLTAPEATASSEADQVERLSRDILQESRGAYAQWVQDPTFVALLLPTGVLGILTVLFKYLFGVQ